MRKLKPITFPVSHCEHPSAERIADEAMRAYGHPWHARNILKRHSAYLEQVGVKQPKALDSALELLIDRARGSVVEVGRDGWGGYERNVSKAYNLTAELQRLEAPIASSGVLELSGDELAEWEAFNFGETLEKALHELAEGLYEMQLVLITTKGGKEYYAQVGDVERAQRTKQGRYNRYRAFGEQSITLRDGLGNIIGGKRTSIRIESVASVDRRGLPSKREYMTFQANEEQA